MLGAKKAPTQYAGGVSLVRAAAATLALITVSGAAQRRLTTDCYDVPNFFDGYWTCADYAQQSICGGNDPWKAEWGDISEYKDAAGNTAIQACCSCGGGIKSPTGAPEDETPFEALIREVDNAPTNGVRATIFVQWPLVWMNTPLIIKTGQNVHLVGNETAGSKKPILDGQRVTIHVYVQKGAMFSATHISFVNGQSHDQTVATFGGWGGSILNMGVLVASLH